MGASGAGFLEGLTEGAERGYGFREAGKARTRAAKLAADLMTLRTQEATRKQILFDEQQNAYHEAESLRHEVGSYLSAPTRLPDGQVGPVQPPTLSDNGRTAQVVGRTLGRLGGVSLDPNEELLMGSGMVPTSALIGLARLRAASKLRGAAGKLPITMDHAFAVLDRIYTTQDPSSGMWRSSLSPGERLRVAKKMVDGSVQPSDLPDIAEPKAPADTTAAPTGGGGFLDRIRNWWQGGTGAMPKHSNAVPTPDGGTVSTFAPRSTTPTSYGVQAPDPSGGVDRVAEARQAIAAYRDLPEGDVTDVLREQGYSDEEIRDILGSP